ncbi:Ig-like domain-containing protein [Listeria booriae]|uniref:Ig-like domain-containing protein n=1 Tax=Listeria booriae TaxID=1552123 RepID=UPI001623FD45|nr:Ig-like domain-containing protein [Listeria booriae]MBC2161739.1 hypothetical protein [Listeria booriae]
MSKNQTMKKVAIAVVAANVVASSLITAMPAKSMAAENPATEAGNKVEQKLMGGLKSSQNLLRNTQFNGMDGWQVSVNGAVQSLIFEFNDAVTGNNNVWNNVQSSVGGNDFASVQPNNDGSIDLRTDIAKQKNPNVALDIYLSQGFTTIPGHVYQISFSTRYLVNSFYSVRVNDDNNPWGGTLVYNSGDFINKAVARTTTFIAKSTTSRIHLKNFTSDNGVGSVRFSGLSIRDVSVVDTTVLDRIDTNSTNASGTGEPDGNIVLRNGDTEIGTGTVDANGNYSITIPKQAYGSTITATVTATATGVTSTANQVVSQGTIITPVISDLTNQSTHASGTGEPGSTLTFKANGIDYPTTVTSAGTWSVTIPKQAANAVVEATSVLNGVSSAKATATVSYEAPNTPVLDNVTNTSTQVTGTGDPGNTITIKVEPSNISYRGTVDSFGKFAIGIDTPDAGATVEAVAQDSTGKISSKATKTVLDVIAPDAPSVNAVKGTDTVISGTGEANCDVAVKLPSGGIIEGHTDSDGNFRITMPKQAIGAHIEVFLTDEAGNKGAATTVTVQADTLASPTVNRVSNQDTKVTGTGIAGATVKVQANNATYTGTVKADGTYEVNVPKLAAGTSISVEQTKSGITSGSVTTIVQDDTAPNAPSINDYYTTDAYAKGTAPGASKVTLYVNGKAVRTAAVNADGNYSIYTGDQASLATAGATFQISASNTAGVESTKTTGTVKSKLTAPVINKYVATDAYARGTASAGSKQVVLYVDGKAIRTAGVNADGTYAIYTGDQAKLATAGNTFQISSKDAAGNESPKATGTVVSVLAAPTIATYYTTDVYATGTTPAGATKVALYVDGKFVRYATVTDGKFSIYTGDQAKLATAGNSFQIASVDAKGTIGNMATATVQADNRVSYQLTATGFNMATDQNVSGTAGSGITRVKIFVNGDVKRQTSVADGAYGIYAKDVITSASDTVEIAGYDAQGFERNRVTVPVTSVAPATYNVTADQYNVFSDEYVTGTADTAITRVKLVVNGVDARTTTTANGTYSIYAQDKITSASDNVQIVALDKDNVARKTISVQVVNDNPITKK